ncbi:MAG: DUF2793 domain-containing protein [Mangrovicoccus sp.]|nr:DUF2793 domain-containing protein [Mangrovicoccus sp.]
MSNTANLELALVQPSQAQKHVTVNEALTRLDGLCQTRLLSISVSTPPVAPQEGAAFGVPAGALEAWEGQDGKLAIFSNGGWVFVSPRPGWRGYIVDLGACAIHDGSDWQPDALAVSPGGAASMMRVIEFDQELSSGASLLSDQVIPAGSVVIGVTGRVIEEITGSLSSWQLGVAGSNDRYGSDIGLSAGAWLRGLTGQPVSYYDDTPLRLGAQSGDFAGGKIRFALHLFTIGLPRA